MRTALVVGPGGIGAAVCTALAADGFTVAVADRGLGEPKRVVDGLGGGDHRPFLVDVTSEESVVGLFDEVERTVGPTAVVVHLAGLLLEGVEPGIAAMPADEWRRTFDVNAFGTFLVVRETLRRRKAAPLPDARLILFSSLAAHVGGIRSSAAYAASKGAVLTLTKSAALEGAPAGLTVNAIAPGLVESPMMRIAVPSGTEAAAAAAIPVGRVGRPEDVASLVSYLASPASGYVTGATLDVNGGAHLR